MSRKILIILIVAISIVALGVSCFVFTKTPKLAYLNNAKLFDSFSLRTELEKKYSFTKNARIKELDSLLMEVKDESITSGQKGIKFEALKAKYLEKKQQFEEDNYNQNKEYTEQIWKQLNQYVKDYGKDHSYQIIFGVSGEGNLMYGEESIDLTEEMVMYCNERYAGK